MRTIRNSFGSLAIIGGLIASLNFVHAQTATVGSFNGNIMQVQPAPADSIVQIAAEAQNLQLMPLDQIPRFGTFWVVSGEQPPLPFPFLPYDPANTPVFSLGADGQFLVDGTIGGQATLNTRRAGRLAASSTSAAGLEAQANAVLNLIDRVQATEANRQMRTMSGNTMTMNGPTPGDGGDGGTNSYTSNASGLALPDYGTNLWIAQVGISSGSLVGIMSNSIADIPYEIQSCENLPGGWSSEGAPVYGSESANWTPFSVAMNNRTNLFLRIRSWADSTGNGIPDWWQLQYFGTTGVDPYGNPAGDGWNNLQKFQNGMNPNVFYTPPAPQLNVSYNPFSGIAAVSWAPALTPATGYTVERFDVNWDVQTNVFNLSASTENLTDSVPAPSGNSWGGWQSQQTYSYYRVQAHYAAGNSAWSAPAYAWPNAFASISLVPGPQGSAYLAVASLPSGTTAIRLTRIDQSAGSTFIDIPVSASTNGLYLLPTSITTSPTSADEYQWQVQIVNNAGATNPPEPLGSGYYSSDAGSFGLVPPYFDGRTQLKQNLIFQLRAAPVDTAFRFWITSPNNNGPDSFGEHLGQYNFPNNYVYSGLVPFYAFQETSTFFDPYLPFEENCLFRNFVFAPADVDTSGNFTTGAVNYYPITTFLNLPLTYLFQINGMALPNLLATNDTRWLFYETFSARDVVEAGIANEDTDWNSYLTLSMPGNVRNWFGLLYLSANVAYQKIDNNTSLGLTTNILYPGAPLTFTGDNIWTVGGNQTIYPETAQPQFQTVEYDFWNPNWTWDPSSETGIAPILPGASNFFPTNTSQQFFTSPGQQIQIAGYAKLAVTNGYPGVYAYLGQYFDQSYQKDANGNVTTNKTGIVSPYGNFFATEPGPAALVTMPDVDTGARGVCTVNCISMVLDKNHDLKMDGSFNGPDATSQASPMVWWINDDYDYSGASWNLGQDLQSGWYYNDGYQQKIDSQRDLEDYARLWICGMPALTNGNYQVTLSWANVSSGNPTINLFDTVETNGGIGYLTNLDTATAEAYNYGIWGENRRAIAQISPSQPFTFPASYFTNAGDKHFLFDGAITNGAGELMLTIADGNGNTIAQTGAWLDLHDVKDFYERAVITNNISSSSISNWTSGIEVVQQATASALGDDTNLIVLVHGFNVAEADWLIQSDTVFKRLYWAGYRGKFMTVKWPAEPITAWNAISENTSIFNNSEIKSYKAGTALKNYLSQLRTRFPNYRLNVLAHSQGNAIMGEAIEQGAPFDTYILTQGAMPASSYDVNAATVSTLLAAEFVYGTPESQPMGYQGVYTNFTGRIFNFYNPFDPVLAVWIADQAAGKPDHYVNHVLFPLASYYSYDGANGWWNGILYGLFSSYLVTDPQESRAMISRSLTESIGRSGPTSLHGVFQSGVDLNAQYGFFNSFPGDHSAQWVWPIQTSLPYYVQILNTIKP